MTKKILPYLLTVFMCMFGQNAFAYSIAVKNADGMTIYYYFINSGTELAVTNSRTDYYTDFRGDDYSGDVVIPESVEYGGKIYKVTYISNEAFFRCSSMTSISIPSSIKSISGDEVFYGCYNLTTVIISDLSSWCNVYFGNASANPLTYAHHLFLNNQKVTKLIIPDDVTNIGSYAFSGCSDLTSVTIPNSVSSIGVGAFKCCNGLTSVIISNSVTSIGSYAFDGTPWLDNQPDGLVYAGKIAYKYKGEMPAYTRIAIKDGTYGIAGDAFFGCKGLTSISIPNSVTSIGGSAFSGCSGLTSITIPNSVTSIGGSAFSGCSGLTSITISNSMTSIGSSAFDGTAWYNNQPDGLVYAGKVAYKYKGEIPANTQIIIKEGTLGIAGYAFYGCSNLTSITIPNSVTSIGSSAFYGCSGLTSVAIPNSVKEIGEMAFSRSDLTSVIIPNSVTTIGHYSFYYCSSLTSVTIPNSVTSIGDRTFEGCKSLTTITSEIEKPFEISDYTFDFETTYNVAELIVPYGTKHAYETTVGWNKFTMITEAQDKDVVAFTIDGIAYEGSKSEKTVVVNAIDTKQTSIEIPASVNYDGITYQVTGITDGVFDGSSLAALIWNVEAALPNNAFSNASISSNFLLYVKSSSYAPSSVKNVVVDGTAQTIVLSDDGGQFYCPQAFTARRISYSHNYSMETGKGSTMGWESIALPFDVQRIIHSIQGEIVPFAAYSSGSNQKPFWLAYMSASGFKRTADIRANEAYIIAMPNNSSYQDNYILAGDVTFSAENITVPQTPSFNGTFLPAFSFVPRSSSVYALNVNNRYVRYSGSEKPGSIFIRDLREVRPFEAYISNSSTRGVIEINFDDGTTDMEAILLTADDCRKMTIHTLSGQQVARTTQRNFDTVWQQLPKSVYIIKGKKMIK